MHVSSIRAKSGALALVLALIMTTSPTAIASDYSHVCRTADGIYEMNDEVLYRVNPPGREDVAITWRRLAESTLRREEGYCISKKAGQRFGYESRTYTLRATFQDEGRKIDADFLCELYSDGMPAAFSCDQQVVTTREGPNAGTSSPPRTSGASAWLHNGSVMRLSANGPKRFFHYEKPRSGIAKAGAKSGTLLFEGQRDGDRYTGQAYIFRKGCQPTPYIVAGEVSAGERRITLRGLAPKVGADCSVVGTRDDTLIFTYMPGPGE